MTEVQYISIGGRSDYLVGLKDLVRGLSKVNLWWAFAVDEVQQRYRRSKLGLAWIVVSYVIFVAAISIFFGGFSVKGVSDFTAHVAVNYAFFAFLIATVTDGCAVFRSNKTWVGSMPLPHSIYVLKSVARALFVLGINMAVGIFVLLATGHLRTSVSWLAVPAFFVVLFNSLLIQTYLGYLTARFRDVEHLMVSLTRVLFFMTPILWVRAEQPVGSLRRTLADLNPFTHAMEIFSAPMLGHMPDPSSWQVMGILTGVNILLMMGASYLAHRRLPYWL
ncbi:MAG: ABC transporter permease [Hyphomonas sp.]|nr:ABC transporter permease [Hyphomonas sp.]